MPVVIPLYLKNGVQAVAGLPLDGMSMLGAIPKDALVLVADGEPQVFGVAPKSLQNADRNVARRETWHGVAVTMRFQLPDDGEQL